LGTQADITALKRDMAALRTALAAKGDLPAEARVTGLAALVNAKTVILAVESYEGYKDGFARDIARPLAKALGEFPAAAKKLVLALQNLPRAR
jgi:hypothetical protein